MSTPNSPSESRIAEIRTTLASQSHFLIAWECDAIRDLLAHIDAQPEQIRVQRQLLDRCAHQLKQGHEVNPGTQLAHDILQFISVPSQPETPNP